MLLKKFWHPTVEKFWLSVWSRGCGKGVGSTGGEAGIVGIVCVPVPVVLALALALPL